jgi:hypothetical protein
MMAQNRSEPPGEDDALNPALHREIDRSHGTRFEGTDPMKTVSVKDPDEGRVWPWIWAVVFIVCIAVAIYYLFI